MKKLFLLGFYLALTINFVNAAYVSFKPYTIKQPNGNAINCFVSGDEYFNWLHDAEGYTIIQAPDGYYYYGVVAGDFVAPSAYRVNEVNPAEAGLRKWAKISKAEYQRKRAYFQDHSRKAPMAPHLGTLNNLAVYIRFFDDNEFTDTRQVFDNKFNQMPGVSLKSYYSEVSYTQFTVSTTHYPACAMTTNYSYRDTHVRAYFEPYNATTNPVGYQTDDDRTYREHTLLRDAINWINTNSPVPVSLNIDGDNDGNVDNVCFNIRGSNGSWAELLWAHSWVLYSYDVFINGKQVWEYTFQPETQIDVQTLCHEMFHAIGAPDLYHYSYDGLQPVQDWDLMEQGFGHMGAYMKWEYSSNSWITNIPEITSSGTYTLNPLSSATNNCYKIASPNSATEFFVVEYRKATGTFESNLPGSGLIVYRIDPTLGGNADGPPDEVYIYRPNGTTSNNGSPGSAYYSSGSGRTSINDGTNPSSFLQNGTPGGLNIYNITTAGTTISFTVGISNVANPMNFAATAMSTSQINLLWQKNGSNDNVMLAYSTTPTIGVPASGTAYVAGNTLPGGGTVLYAGAGTTYNHTSLSSSTTYYYKLWSVASGNNYSNGISQEATTLCNTSTLPYTQNFQTELLPPCWTTQYSGSGAVDSWSLSQTSNAGGTAWEMMSSYQQINPGTTRLVTLPFNTSGMTQLNLSFRHMLDDYAPGATLRVQSSSNGSTWTNEAWSLATTSNSNVGPVLVNATVTNNLNSASTYIAFTIEGDLYQYDYWYIDDVSVSNGGSQSVVISTSSNPVAGGSTSGGGTYLTGQTVILLATPSVSYNFLNWTENGNVVSSNAAFSFTAAVNRTLIANFSMSQVTVATSSNPPTGGTTSGGGTFPLNQQVTVLATPNTGYEFINWMENGIIVSTSASYSFTTTESRNLVANFSVQQFTISTSSNPISAGITTGGGTFSYNASVTVIATPNSGWEFSSWSENGTTVSSDAEYTFNALANRVLVANFSPETVQYVINASANPVNGGNTTGGGTYNSGEQVTLIAIANQNWAFVNWTEYGSQVSTNASYSFTADGNRTLTANFVQQYTITATPDPAAAGYTSGGGLYNSGEQVTVQAFANSGWVFSKWTENGNTVSTSDIYSFYANASRNLVAGFVSTVDIQLFQPPRFTIYPNPSDGQILVENSTLSYKLISEISLINVTGEFVYRLKENFSDKMQIDISGNTPGMYNLRILLKDDSFLNYKIMLSK